MDPDPDPGGPKTYASYGSGKLVTGYRLQDTGTEKGIKYNLHKIFCI
jgi:hypothetical protein